MSLGICSAHALACFAYLQNGESVGPVYLAKIRKNKYVLQVHVYLAYIQIDNYITVPAL